jgi:ectoine hydroxylase-related dioxygenase (phytanoyl-CoA dioxygenase family)
MPSKLLPAFDLSEPAQLKQTISRALKCYLNDGCVLLKNVFDAKFVLQLQQEFKENYQAYFKPDDFSDALTVGDKRTMITVEVKDSFNSEYFYANPNILKMMVSLLGRNHIMGSMGAVISLPGSEDQHTHRDHHNIYHGARFYPRKEHPLTASPPYAITVVIPLVPINEATGCTRVWPGSHLSAIRPKDVNQEDSADFTTELGDCLLMDYRLIHHGMANNSNMVRPIMYNIYSSAWFRDVVNYKNQKPLVISEDEFNQVPEQHRYLFEWSRKQ